MQNIAYFYDELSKVYRPDELTSLEIDLIKSIIKRNDKILDIGCGTGRHLIPLMKLEYDVIGIDNSKESLNILLNKQKNAKVFLGSFLKFDKFEEFTKPRKIFNLIICMYNSLNEIAEDKFKLNNFLKKCKDLFKSKGTLLLNFHDANGISASNLDFLTYIGKYIYKCEVVDSDEKNHSYHLMEFIMKERGEIICVNNFYQKYWKKEEIEEELKILHLNFIYVNISVTNDIYMIIN